MILLILLCFVHRIFIIKIFTDRAMFFAILFNTLFNIITDIIIILKLSKTKKKVNNIINLSDSRLTKFYISNIRIEVLTKQHVKRNMIEKELFKRSCAMCILIVPVASLFVFICKSITECNTQMELATD